MAKTQKGGDERNTDDQQMRLKSYWLSDGLCKRWWLHFGVITWWKPQTLWLSCYQGSTTMHLEQEQGAPMGTSVRTRTLIAITAFLLSALIKGSWSSGLSRLQLAEGVKKPFAGNQSLIVTPETDSQKCTKELKTATRPKRCLAARRSTACWLLPREKLFTKI